MLSRRAFLASTASLAVTAGITGARRDGAERQVRSRHQGRRRARSEPIAARQARHRHPLRPDRGARGRHPGRAGAARARRRRQAGDAGPDRPALPRLSLRLGDRHSGRRARRAPMHDHLRVGGRRRRQQLRGLPPPHRGADAHAALCLRAHRQYRARRRSRSPSSTTSTSRRWMPAPRRSPRMPTWCSASRCACRRT